MLIATDTKGIRVFKFNPYHDSASGEFTHGGGTSGEGGGGVSASGGGIGDEQTAEGFTKNGIGSEEASRLASSLHSLATKRDTYVQEAWASVDRKRGRVAWGRLGNRDEVSQVVGAGKSWSTVRRG